MSGLRRCTVCDKLVRISDAGPEAMRSDGSFPKHYCREHDQTRVQDPQPKCTCSAANGYSPDPALEMHDPDCPQHGTKKKT